jgi:hypothetical protein
MKVTVNNDSYSIDLIQSANPAEDAVHALAAIIEEDLPQRLANAELMLDYGSVRRPADTLDAWHRVMQEPCNARLIDALHSALGLMKRAEPIQRGRVASAIANFTGAKLEAELKREIALCELERTLADATEAAEQVRAHIGKVDSLRQENKADRISLAAHIKAGSDHLARIAPAGMAPPDENHARLRRKVQELANILASAEILQLELARARSTAIDLLERQTTLQNALVPIWRQHGGRATATVAARFKVENGLAQTAA